MEVTDVLRDRMREPAGFQGMVAISIALHAALIAAAILAPGGILNRSAAAPTEVMTISLSGGGEGPRAGGISSIGGRAIQAETPPDAKREAIRPPAAETPEMTIPVPNAKPAKPTPEVRQAPDEARGRTPTRGKEVAAGSALAETGARGQGFGLSTGGGAGTGSTIDAVNFCCPDYIVLMVDRIRANWLNQRPAGQAGMNIVKFTIQRDGRITDVLLEKSSGFQNLDLASQRALYATKTLNPLPDGYPNPALTIHLNFEYLR
jgi:TonB family protein